MSDDSTELAVIDKPNYFALVVGPPEHGKSSLAARLAEERLKQGRWLLAQDTNRDFKRFCVRYETTGDFLAAASAAAAEGTAMPRGASFACPRGADEVIAVAKELGLMLNQVHGCVRTPMCIVVNEAGSFKESGNTHIGDLQEYVINQRRHLGLELIYCLQRPTQLPKPFWDVITDAYLFAQNRKDRVLFLEDMLDLEKGSLACLHELPPHRYVHWQPRKGHIGGLQ